MGLRLFFQPNFPRATFIQGATFIPDSRVVEKFYFNKTKKKCRKRLLLDCKSNRYVALVRVYTMEPTTL